jgi:uncharacterized membrane protein
MEYALIKKVFSVLMLFVRFVALLASFYFVWYINFRDAWLFLGWYTTIAVVVLPHILLVFLLPKFNASLFKVKPYFDFWLFSINLTALATVYLPGKIEEPFIRFGCTVIAGIALFITGVWFLVGIRLNHGLNKANTRTIALFIVISLVALSAFFLVNSFNYKYYWLKMICEFKAEAHGSHDLYSRFIFHRNDYVGLLTIVYELNEDQIDYLVIYEKHAGLVSESELVINRGQIPASCFYKKYLLHKTECKENDNTNDAMGYPLVFFFFNTDNKTIPLHEIPERLNDFHKDVARNDQSAISICLNCDKKPVFTSCEKNHLEKVRTILHIAGLKVLPSNLATRKFDMLSCMKQ